MYNVNFQWFNNVLECFTYSRYINVHLLTYLLTWEVKMFDSNAFFAWRGLAAGEAGHPSVFESTGNIFLSGWLN